MHNALNERRNLSIYSESLVSLTKLILENNVFEFDSKCTARSEEL